MNNVKAENKEQLVGHIVLALEELAIGNGDMVTARINCRQTILQANGMTPYRAEKLTNKLIDKAKEMSLKFKAVDLKEDNADGTKQRFTDDSKDITEPADKGQLLRKSKVKEHKTNSVNMDALKNRLKETLLTSIENIINELPLSPVKRRELKDKLNNIVYKDLDKSALIGKQDLGILRNLILKDNNEALETSPIPKSIKNMIKFKLAEVLDTNINELILSEGCLRKERLRKLHDVIAKLPISKYKKTDLKDTLANIYDETNQTIISQLAKQSKLNEEMNTIPGSKSKKKNSFINKLKKKKMRVPKIEETYTFHKTISKNPSFDQKSKDNFYLVRDPAELKYVNHIESCVNNWFKITRINTKESETDKIVRKLTHDIVDRKKYIQINPTLTPNYEEDLHYLKFQVHRRVNKYIHPDKLKPIIEETTQLLNKINQVKVPIMIIPPGFSTPTVRPPPVPPWFSPPPQTPGVRDTKYLDDLLNKNIANETTTKTIDPIETRLNIAQKNLLFNKITNADIFNKHKQNTPRSRKSILIEMASTEFQVNPVQLTAETPNICTCNADDENPKICKNIIKEVISKAISDAVDQSTISDTSKNCLKSKLIINMEKTIENARLDHKKDIDDVRESILNESKHIVDKTTIPVNQKKHLKSFLSGTLGQDLGVNQTLVNSSDFNPVYASTPKKPANGVSMSKKINGKEYTDKLTDIIKTWMNNVPVGLNPQDETNVAHELATDVIDRQKYLHAHPKAMLSNINELEHLKFNVFKRLSKMMEAEHLIPIIPRAEELFDEITSIEIPEDFLRKWRPSMENNGQEHRRKSVPSSNALGGIEDIADILDKQNISCKDKESLMQELQNLTNSGASPDETLKSMTARIKQLTNMNDEQAEELARKMLGAAKEIASLPGTVPIEKKDFKEAMLKDIGDVFYGCPMSDEKRKLMESQLAEQYAQDLGIPLIDSDKTGATGSSAKKGNYGMSFNGLTDFIDSWLDNIHIHDDTKGEDEIKDIKKDLAYNLVQKIGEMNVDPEIFKDDSLYEDILRDELKNLLGDITITDENLQSLQEDLISKVKEAQKRAHDETVGQNYKQNLRDTLSNILPDQRNFSKEEQPTMEILKDQLADAFINLHYSGNDDNLKAQLKSKISNEINVFCDNYLRKHPGETLSSQKLNNDLYTALNKVSVPTGDSIRYEVEQVRIREEIDEWLKDLPLQPQSPADLLARNKMVYVLSKKLFDIEVDADDANRVPLMSKQIIKFLNRMPVQPGQNNIALADKLIERLKATEVSRKFNATSNVTGIGSDVEDSMCPYYKLFLDKQKAPPCGRPCQRKQYRSYPPCSLSPEDIVHLERIRRRNCLSPKCIMALLRNHKRNAGVGPSLIDTESQTELQGTEEFRIEQPQQSPICPASNEKTPRPCPGVPVGSRRPSGYSRRPTISSSKIGLDNRGEIEPHIIVKEYHWDNAADNSNFQESVSKQPGSPPCHQSDSSSSQQPCLVPCDQPGSSLYQQFGKAPNHQIDTSRYQQSDTAPYHQPSTSPYQQPVVSPQTETSPYQPSGRESRPDFPSYDRQPSIIPQQPSPTRLSQQNTSPQRMTCDQFFKNSRPKTSPQSQSDRYPHWSPTFQIPQDTAHRSPQCSRSPRSSSPCMSPLPSTFGARHKTQNSPSNSSRHYDSQMPKRNGLQDHPCTINRTFRKDRVFELGSLDDLCNPRPKKRNTNNFDWSYAKFPEDDNFWGEPCMRRVILNEGIDEPLLMEREQREERARCKCRDRLILKSTKCHGKPCNQGCRNINRCSKCCGLNCPYPSYMYFRE